MIDRSRKCIADVIQPLLPGSGENIALVDFPNHANVGDSAIWLGEQQFLQQNGFNNRIYTCEISTYSKESMADAIGHGTIFLHGGGNLGDLWETHQDFREQILTDFPNNRIIQLPQSICFRDERRLQKAKDIFELHSDFTVLARDRESLSIASSQLGVKSFLCPDMAFWIGQMDVPVTHAAACVWLQRKDKESCSDNKLLYKENIWLYDWLHDEVTPTIQSNILLHQYYMAETDNINKEDIRRNLSNIYPKLAQERVLRGCKILARGKLVVTERLHGHILCMLMGIPHYIIDTRYGKISNYINTWEYKSPLVTWCESEEHALSMLSV